MIPSMANEALNTSMEEEQDEATGQEQGEEQLQQQLSQQAPLSQPQPPPPQLLIQPSSQQQPQTAAAATATQPQQPKAAQSKGRQKKQPEFPCLGCGKNVTGASVQCTLCTLWCHRTCSSLTQEALKALEVQAHEVGIAYWACRSCLAFASKVNRQLQTAGERQDAIEAKVEGTISTGRENSQRIDRLEDELNRMRIALEAKRAEKNYLLCDELREREIRKNNLVIHGIQEAEDISYNRDRMERDKNICGELFRIMNVRTKPEDLRFCRRVGQRGRDPRPIIIGLRTEEEKRAILDRTNTLPGTRFDNLSVGPDQTRMQRQGEERLVGEAKARNRQLTSEDIEKNQRWLVVGRKGLIKGTEREQQQFQRAGAQLGDFVHYEQRYGHNSNSNSNIAATGARYRDTNPASPNPPETRQLCPDSACEQQQATTALLSAPTTTSSAIRILQPALTTVPTATAAAKTSCTTTAATAATGQTVTVLHCPKTAAARFLGAAVQQQATVQQQLSTTSRTATAQQYQQQPKPVQSASAVQHNLQPAPAVQ
jgi:hypothetical protein